MQERQNARRHGDWLQNRGIGLITTLLALVLMATAGYAQSAKFRFNPPNGASFVETTVITATNEIPSKGKSTQVQETKTRITFKKTGSGYTATFTPISATLTVDGKKVSSASESEFKDTVLTYLLNNDGKVMIIKGLNQMLKKAIAKLPAESAKKVDLAKEEKKMIEARKKEWDSQISKFAGKTVKAGDAWTTTDSLPLPGNTTVKATKKLKFFLPVKVNGHDCVKIVSSISADEKALKEAMNRAVAEDTKGKDGAKPRVASIDVTLGGERIIDPATMLVYSEKISRTTRLVVEVPGKGTQTMITTEIKESKIDYKK